MAAGSHAEKGICALLVILDATIISIITGIAELLLTPVLVNPQSPADTRREMLIRIPTSPTRLVKAVIIPAL
jgi:hypothetical protein